jgi:microcystin-dependent protein
MDHYRGEVRLFPNRAPLGWASCDGQQLPIAGNKELFSVLGTSFGGNGKTTFALPDLRDREPHPNLHFCIALTGKLPWPPEFSPQKD